MWNRGSEVNKPNPLFEGPGPEFSVVVHAGQADEKAVRCRRVVTLIGSRSGCRLILKHRKVSAVHAAIINDGTDLLAIDLVSRLGTRLNDLQLSCERLNDTDRLTVHTWDLQVRIETSSVDEPDLDQLIALEGAAPGLTLKHESTGNMLTPQREICIMGRRQGCDVVLSDNRVSRVHALLFSFRDQPAVFDLLSRNHTFVNDEAVEFCLLKDGDMLRLGDTEFKIQLLANALAGGLNGRGQLGGVQETGRSPEDTGSDLIDIHTTESSQRWKIAESSEKAPRKP